MTKSVSKKAQKRTIKAVSNDGEKPARGRPRKERSAGDDGKTHRSWEFTDYDLSQERKDWWQGLDCKFNIAAHEQCPTTGKDHMQGRIIMRRAYRFAALKKIFPAGVHFEPTKAEGDSNYFRKHGTVLLWEIDNRCQGKRTVFHEIKESLASGGKMADILAMDDLNYQSLRSAELLIKYVEEPREIAPVEVIISTGPQAVQHVYDDCQATEGGIRCLYEPLSPDCWEGYDAHEVVHIRHGPKLTADLLWKLMDKYPFRVGNKGSSRQARYRKIYISVCDEMDLQLEQRRYVQERVVYEHNLTSMVTRYIGLLAESKKMREKQDAEYAEIVSKYNFN